MAYASQITGGGDIYTANIDGSNPIRLTKTETLGEENPAFSPAGNKIAFQAADPTAFRHIFLYRADGLFLAQVSPSATGFQEEDVCWSPRFFKASFYAIWQRTGASGPIHNQWRRQHAHQHGRRRFSISLVVAEQARIRIDPDWAFPHIRK